LNQRQHKEKYDFRSGRRKFTWLQLREQETESLLGTGTKHEESGRRKKIGKDNDSSKKRKRNCQWHPGFTRAEDWCQQQRNLEADTALKKNNQAGSG
jgi:hypothetical protein